MVFVSEFEVQTLVVGMFPLRTVHVRVETLNKVEGNLMTSYPPLSTGFAVEKVI